jgi:hypothetical protein
MLLLFIAEAEMNVPITSMNLLQSDDVICVTVNDVTPSTKTDTFVIILSNNFYLTLINHAPNVITDGPDTDGFFRK